MTYKILQHLPLAECSFHTPYLTCYAVQALSVSSVQHTTFFPPVFLLKQSLHGPSFWMPALFQHPPTCSEELLLIALDSAQIAIISWPGQVGITSFKRYPAHISILRLLVIMNSYSGGLSLLPDGELCQARDEV